MAFTSLRDSRRRITANDRPCFLPRLLFLLLPLVAVLYTVPCSAQRITPAQIEQLRSLPQAQQQQMLRSLNVDPAMLRSVLGDQSGALQRDASSDALDSLEQLRGEAQGMPAEAADEQVVLQPRSTLLIKFSVKEEVLAELEEQGEELPAFLQVLEGRQSHELDRYGVLHLVNVFHIRLAGLTEEQAAARIASEPGLESFDVVVVLLPLSEMGLDSLDLFGTGFFARAESLLLDPSEVVVPGDYVLGPGDVLLVHLFGATNAEYRLPVTSEGTLVLPDIGPVTVAGLSLDQVRDDIVKRIQSQLIGVNASVTLEQLRSIQIFVLGDVKAPGAYIVDGQTTITNALLLSGGVEDNGSLRRVELKRGGARVTVMDLYDLLLRGDTRRDQRLRNGDVVLVPPIGDVAGVEGAVVRPARYELLGGETVGDLLQLAGGAASDAQLSNARLERVLPSGVRTVLNVDLGRPQGRDLPLRNGDFLRVRPALDRLVDSVELTGHVRQPGFFAWYDGLRLTDVIRSPDDLADMADTGYLLIRREDAVGRVSAAAADLRRALANPGTPADLLLRPRDRISVFELGADRSGVISPLLRELRDQRGLQEPTPEASLAGAVIVPGQYPVTPQMRLSDLIRAGGGLTDLAFVAEAELTRTRVIAGREVELEVLPVDLDRVLAGDSSADLLVQPRDYLFIKLVPRALEEEKVTLEGEVVFPGTYPIMPGETLAAVIERAGGLTDRAFPGGSRFTRESLREREAMRLEQLADRLERDLAAAAVQRSQEDAAFGASEALRLAQELLGQIREAPAEGRLVIDLQRILAAGPGSERDVVLRDGDQLLVPKISQEVTVIGEVQFPGSHLYERGLKLDDYLDSAGGLSRQADSKRVYVVRANGEVLTGGDSRWFSRGRIGINAGDTIVVPLDADRLRPLALWSSVSTILYQIGLSAATASALGVF